MDERKYNELQRRAARVKEIVDEIRQLERADPLQPNVSCKIVDTRSDRLILPGQLTEKVFIAGRCMVMETLLREAEGLVAIVPEPDDTTAPAAAAFAAVG